MQAATKASPSQEIPPPSENPKHQDNKVQRTPDLELVALDPVDSTLDPADSALDPADSALDPADGALDPAAGVSDPTLTAPEIEQKDEEKLEMMEVKETSSSIGVFQEQSPAQDSDEEDSEEEIVEVEGEEKTSGDPTLPLRQVDRDMDRGSN